MKIIGTSEVIDELNQLIGNVAKTCANVLITGESGTGKELVAQNIHLNSCRKDKPFVTVNCGAIPRELLESELFGHEKGAFTGAYSQRIGRFEMANKGTIFLDEIGDMPLDMQVKLLRVLQDKKIERVGGCKSIDVDIRVVAATNKNLETKIEEEKFREDLYYRLNVFPIYIKPLRERKGDIPLLIEHFLSTYNKNYGKNCSVSSEVIGTLSQYDWPGNVRELGNIIERLSIMSAEKQINVSDLPEKFVKSKNSSISNRIMSTNNRQEECKFPCGFNLKEHVAKIERQYILDALDLSGNVVTEAAKLLGVRRTTLVEKMKKYHLSREMTGQALN